MACPFDNDPVDEGAALLHRELNIRRAMVIRQRIFVLAFPDNFLFERHHQNLLGQKKKRQRQRNICMNRLKKISIGLLHFIKALVSWGVDG